MEEKQFVLADNNKLNHKSFMSWLHGFVMTSGGKTQIHGNTEFVTGATVHEDGSATYSVSINTILQDGNVSNAFLIKYKSSLGFPVVEITYNGELDVLYGKVSGVTISNVEGLSFGLRLERATDYILTISPGNCSEFLIYNQIMEKLDKVLTRTGLKRPYIVQRPSTSMDQDLSPLELWLGQPQTV